jgi:hypothetical protein
MNLLDNVFLTLSGIYMAYMVYSISMFPGDVPVIAKIVLLGLMLTVAGLRVMLIGFKTGKVWLGAGLCVIYAGVFYFSGNSNFLFLAACTIGFLEIDYRKIIRTYLIVIGTSLALVTVAAMTGIVDNLRFVKNGHFRYSMGTIYPTDFASLVLFFALYLWVGLKRMPGWVSLVLPLVTFALAWRVAYSTTSMICSVLFFSTIVYHERYNCMLHRHPKLCATNDWIIAGLVFLFSFLSVGLLFTYKPDGELMQRIDKSLSYRISIPYQGMKTYGLHPFGSRFSLIGYGSTQGAYGIEGYNFIDNSYLLSLIRYGYLCLITVVFQIFFIVRKAQKYGDRRLALVVALIAFHSLSEHHLVDVYYNIALAMPLAKYSFTESEVLDIRKPQGNSMD